MSSWRLEALSGADAVAVDSFNDWVGGTQIEAAEASASECERAADAASAAVPPACSPSHARSYANGADADAVASVGGRADGDFFIKLTAVEARRARTARPYALPTTSVARLASTEERMKSWRGHEGGEDDGDPAP